MVDTQRVHAVLKGLTFEPDPATLSDDPARFVLTVRMMVGPSDGPGEDSFDLTVCTPEWLAEQCRDQGGLYDLRHHLVVSSEAFDYRAVRSWLEVRVRAVEAATWSEVGQRLGRLASWEFEDYRE